MQVLKCEKCGNTTVFEASATEWCTWSVDEYGEFTHKIDTHDAEVNYYCPLCDSENVGFVDVWDTNFVRA